MKVLAILLLRVDLMLPTKSREDMSHEALKDSCHCCPLGFEKQTILIILNLNVAQVFPTMVRFKVRKAAKIRNRYNQVPHLTQGTIWESDKTQLNITHKSQEVSPFPAGDHKAAIW